jgi:hypothetical protein
MANSKKGTAQINPPTPKQIVADKFGGKNQIVDSILALYDAPEGSRGKLKQVSNSKLLSHLRNTDRLIKQFGSRQGAVDAILAIKYPKGNAPESEKTKLAAANPWKLADQLRQAKDLAAKAAKAK